MSRRQQYTTHLGLIDRTSRSPTKPPGLLRVIQRNSSAHYEQLLAHMFSSVDDLFYDLSKRATSNQEQNLYFEAMRDIRIKREGVANQFLRTLAHAYSKLITQPGDLDDVEAVDNGPLSIVKGDDLEVELAVSNMVSRTRDVYRSELHELEARLDHLLLQVETNEDNNPLNPFVITSAFVGACQECLESGIKAKLILFKLFEKHVLKQLGHVYADANQVLVDAGILPKVPSSLRGRRKGEADEQRARSLAGDVEGSQPQPQEGSSASEFRMQNGALNLLMEAARGLAHSLPPAATPSVYAPAGAVNSSGFESGQFSTPQYFIGTATRPDSQSSINCYVYSGNPGSVMSAPELALHLTQSQSKMDKHLLQSGTPQNIVPSVIHKLLAKEDPRVPHALRQSDENIINLVSMFFDQILADESLHVLVQALICRLQIPILKIALRDQTFFSHSTHPARKLINTITALGVGFDENKPIDRDPVYRKISEIVKALNVNYKAEDDIFTTFQADLDLFVEKEKRKAKVVEQRATQAEEGKLRVRQARKATQDILYRALRGGELPGAVKSFLITHWLQVMIVTNLKRGADSQEWASNEQTVTDLVWISKSHKDARSIQRRERMLPELLDRLEVELEIIIADPAVRHESIVVLEEALRATSVEPTLDASSSCTLTEDQKSALGQGGDSPKAWADMTAVEKQKSRYEELSTSYYETAKNIAVGTWLEYKDESGLKPLRCKVASKADADNYLFVNRLGFKVLEKSRKQFAYDMQSKRARVLDARPLFDRIMGKVVGDLSSSKS